MAGVTIHAVVYIPVNALMPLIGRGFGMAVGAGEDRIIGGVGVARRAHAIGPAVVRVEPRVIERRARPRSGCVACGAGRWEPGCLVVGIRGAVVVRFVAGVAIRRCADEHVVHVA